MRRCSLLLVRDHPDRSFGRCSKKAPGRPSAARQRLKPFRIPSPLDPDVRGGTFDVTEIFGRKFNVSGSEVFSDIESASSNIRVEGARYPEWLQPLSGR